MTSLSISAFNDAALFLAAFISSCCFRMYLMPFSQVGSAALALWTGLAVGLPCALLSFWLASPYPALASLEISYLWSEGDRLPCVPRVGG